METLMEHIKNKYHRTLMEIEYLHLQFAPHYKSLEENEKIVAELKKLKDSIDIADQYQLRKSCDLRNTLDFIEQVNEGKIYCLIQLNPPVYGWWNWRTGEKTTDED